MKQLKNWNNLRWHWWLKTKLSNYFYFIWIEHLQGLLLNKVILNITQATVNPLTFLEEDWAGTQIFLGFFILCRLVPLGGRVWLSIFSLWCLFELIIQRDHYNHHQKIQTRRHLANSFCYIPLIWGRLFSKLNKFLSNEIVQSRYFDKLKTTN